MTAVARTSADTSPTAVALLIIAVAFALRAVVGTLMGFTFDETYHVIMARSPALGYSDHPPMTMWLIAASTRLFGSESHLVVRLPTLLLFAGASWYIYRLTALFFGTAAGLYALILLNLSPQFGAFIGMVAITDGPIIFGLAAAGYYLARAMFASPPGQTAWADWLLAGFFFGFSVLSKYTVILTGVGVLAFFLTQPEQRKWMARPAPYAALAVAILTMIPVVYWNATNDWASFTFQGSRAAFDGALHYERLARLFIGLFFMLMPPIFVGLIIALVDGFRRGPSDAKRWYLAWLAVVPIVFFAMVWFLGRNEARGYHWVAPGFLFAFPLLGAALAELTGRAALWRRKVPIVASLAVILVAFAVFVTHIPTGWVAYFLPDYKRYDSLVADQTDWTSLRADLEARGMLDPDKYFVVVARWEFCHKANYAFGDRMKIICLDDNPVGFAKAHEQADLVGKDAVIVNNWWRSQVRRDDFLAGFTAVEPPQPVVITRYGIPVMSLDLVVAEKLKAPFVARSYGPTGGTPPG